MAECEICRGNKQVVLLLSDQTVLIPCPDCAVEHDPDVERFLAESREYAYELPIDERGSM